MQSETKTPLGSIPRCEFNRKLLRVDRVTLTPPANVTLRNALLLGTLNYLLIDAAFNLEIDVCFIVLIGGYDIVVPTGGFPEEQFCPPFDGQTSQMLSAINLRVNIWKTRHRSRTGSQGSSRDRQERCDSGSL